RRPERATVLQEPLVPIRGAACAGQGGPHDRPRRDGVLRAGDHRLTGSRSVSLEPGRAPARGRHDPAGGDGSVSRFRLALINPNTGGQPPVGRAGAASAAPPAGAEVMALTAPRGPGSIETATEEVLAAAEVLELVRTTHEADAYLIACFG